MNGTDVVVNTRRKVLIVDDEPELLEVATEVMILAGYQVVSAENGHRALAVLRENDDISMIFSDIKMPKMDGIAFLKQLKLEFGEIPICMISGFSNHAEKEVMDLGASAYLSKPYSVKALMETAANMQQGSVDARRDGLPERQKIYVVEDDALDRKLLESALGKQTWKGLVDLRFFDGGENLISAMNDESEIPALIIFDINLPGLSGIDTLMFLKTEKWLPIETKILVLSGSKLANDRQRCKDLAVDGFYQKPFSQDSWWHLARSIGQSWLRTLE